MKKILLFFMLILFCNISFGQSLFVEEFTYTAGDLLTAHNWSQSGTTTTNPLSVTSPGLVYMNYPSVDGNACTLAVTGQDVYQSYSDVSSGDLYISFLVNVQTAGTGDYFIALSPSTSQTNYYMRVHIKSNGTGFSLGLSKSNEVTGGATYGNTVLNFNTSYLVVCKHTFIADANTDDVESVFVFADPNIPATEPATPEVGPYVNATKNDPTNLGYVTIRQGSSSSAATLIIDGIRLATSWKSLLPQSGFKAPVAISATNDLSNGFTANWNSVNGATNYLLDVSATSDFSTLISGFDGKDVGSVTSYKVTGLDPNIIYYYRVRAFDGTNTSAHSNTITVVTVLAAPVANDATNVSTTTFTANWSASTGATNYWLDVSTSSDFSTFVAGFENKDIGNITRYDVSSLTAGSIYYYRLRASNENGTSNNSNIITVGTGTLATPLALSAANISTIGFTARWNSSPTATTYLLDVSATADFSTFVAGYEGKDVGNVTNYTVVSLNGSTLYYYRVRASNSGGTSANSNVISVTTLLAAPVAKTASSITTSGFIANWDASTGATNYWVDISTMDDFSNILESYNNKNVGNVTSYNISSLNANTVYYFRVSASNKVGTSPYSNTITVTTNITGVDDLLNLPTKFDLSQNYPNPFNPTTIIKYRVPENTFVSLKVYNILGSEIATLVNGVRTAGAYEVKFDASQLTSGIYIYRIQAGSFLQTKKMILVK